MLNNCKSISVNTTPTSNPKCIHTIFTNFTIFLPINAYPKIWTRFPHEISSTSTSPFSPLSYRVCTNYAQNLSVVGDPSLLYSHCNTKHLLTISSSHRAPSVRFTTSREISRRDAIQRRPDFPNTLIHFPLPIDGEVSKQKLTLPAIRDSWSAKAAGGSSIRDASGIRTCGSLMTRIFLEKQFQTGGNNRTPCAFADDVKEIE